MYQTSSAENQYSSAWPWPAPSRNVVAGMATSADSKDTLDELMTKADLALYAAKGAGKARSQLFHAQMDIDYHYRQRLKTDLREALAC